ncbi:MAG: PaaI family thioesterase [Anaerolineales bacterium]
MTERGIRARSQSWLEVGEAMVRGEIPQPPVATLVGFELVAFERGKATMSLRAGEQHANPMGSLHGGVLCDVADAAMGMAFASTLEAEETFTTLELKINFMKPIWDATLQAVGRVVQRGRSIGLVECDILDEDGSFVARASSTCMALRDEQARGR